MAPKRTLDDVVSETADGPILHKDLLLKWRAFRERFPIRAPGVPPVTYLYGKKPPIDLQRTWQCYTFNRPTHFQQWLFTPFMEYAHVLQEPAADIPPSARMNRYDIEDNVVVCLEHYTNIQHMEFVALQHPLVESVQPHKISKGLQISIKDEFGRAKKGGGTRVRGTSN